MRFALVDGKKTEPQPKLRGVCPSCHADMLARCGEVRVHHWAHKGVLSCDPWWEKETEWHRSWKSHFPVEWQEVGHVDEVTGERHIADVKTEAGLVIEFQHSHLKPEEQRAREQFYKNMVWVIDGVRLQRDFPRFLKARDDFRLVNPSLCLVDFYDECFPKAWLSSSVPVAFDFRRAAVDDETEKAHESLWCLLPRRVGRRAVVVAIAPEEFIASTRNGALVERFNQVMVNADGYEAVLAEKALQAERAYIQEKYRYRARRHYRL